MEKKCSVLIVDDDPGMRESLADILDAMGYGVAVAEDGYSACEKIKEGSYDVALMDVRMPGMNGVETFKEVKKIRPSTKVIIMTAFAVEELIKEALKEGASAVVYKPLYVDKVVALIEMAVKESMVLVVDDDANTCDALKDVLEAKKYSVLVARSGKEAIDSVKAHAIDIVLLDVNMPILNGLETYLAMKEIAPGITTVMMTGYREEVAALMEKAMEKNVIECLYKPLDMDKLMAYIESTLWAKADGTLKKGRYKA